MSNTLSSQSLKSERDEQGVQTATEKLQKLELKTQGKWVECTCTDVEDGENRLRFSFETFHDRRERKAFNVPDVLAGSDVKNFLDSVGYTASNANLMEGSEFWWNIETGEITDSPPSAYDKKKESVHDKLSYFFESHINKLKTLCLIIGAGIIFPISSIGFSIHMCLQSTSTLLDDNPDTDDAGMLLVISIVISVFWTIVVINTLL